MFSCMGGCRGCQHKEVVPGLDLPLIFDHAQEHQGNLIHEGRKKIVLRTEVMFTLVPR
jgi:hypothetical protein